MDFNDVVIVYVKGNNYRIYFWYASKDDAISIMKNSDLTKKKTITYICLGIRKNDYLLSKK